MSNPEESGDTQTLVVDESTKIAASSELADNNEKALFAISTDLNHSIPIDSCDNGEWVEYLY